MILHSTLLKTRLGILQLIQDNFSQKDRENILFKNALKFYDITI